MEQRLMKRIPLIVTVFLLFFTLRVKAADYGNLIATGDCGASNSSIRWSVYDSNNDSIADMLLLDGSGLMDDYEIVWKGGTGEIDMAYTSIPWIQYSQSISSIICKGTITHIGDCAFAYTRIDTIDLSHFCASGLTIGRFSFFNCTSLRLTELPSNIVSIDDAAFENCYQIQNIYLPDSIVNIGRYGIGFDCQIVGDIITPSRGFSISCEKGSEAYRYGLTNNLQVSIVHRYTTVIKGIAATCTKPGLTDGQKCSVCGEVLKAQETIPAKGHTVVKDKAVDPTYSSTGLTEGSHCSVCNKVLVAQKVVPKLEPKSSGRNLSEGSTEEQEPITINKVPSSVKAKAKKNKVTVSWKKIKKNKAGKKLLKQIKSIQVQYSTDPKFKKDAKTKTVGKKKTKVTLKLQKKTTYYVRVRYKGSNGFSKWSKMKKVKTKK